MRCGDCSYIWEASAWPHWHYDLATLAGSLAEVSRGQGLLMGRLTDVGLALRNQASLAALTEDVVKTSEIEGDNSMSNPCAPASHVVWASLLVPWLRWIAMLKVSSQWVLDATLHCQRSLTPDRLFGWHAALFPSGYSGLSPHPCGHLA